jgi:hypothetical protein
MAVGLSAPIFCGVSNSGSAAVASRKSISAASEAGAQSLAPRKRKRNEESKISLLFPLSSLISLLFPLLHFADPDIPAACVAGFVAAAWGGEGLVAGFEFGTGEDYGAACAG